MTENPQARRGKRTRMGLALSAVGLILALLVVPPFISVQRYKSRITQVISASVGRPVRLSSVELRILPRPSFVITDLVVEEDPAYGNEPVLHANTVTASIRVLPWWWRARLEISQISVDEASLNLVRNGAGHWNLDALFRTAARPQEETGKGAIAFPYLEATDSRVNIKDGVEKLPFSLVNADLSIWQESPGEWRVRLKGQPARTDVNLDLADTGIVRLEGQLERTRQLRRIHLDVDWREAQLGQLSRLVLGDDEGWRGALTGEVHVDGTAEAADVHTRLRASGVHRAEFAPASPIDFDASCSFVYHYSERSADKLECNSPVGNGRAHLTGEVPGHNAHPRLSLELDRVPAQVALDTLRTVRSGLNPSLQAAGVISGKIDYAPTGAPATATAARPGARAAKLPLRPAQGPLSGSITISGLRIAGDGLSRPIFIPKVTIDPAPGQPPALVASVAIPLGAPTPLNLNARLALAEYQVGMRGGAPLARLRELAHVAGIAHASALDKVDGPPAMLDLTANGPWLHPPSPALPDVATGLPANPVGPSLVAPPPDRISGTLTLRTVKWTPEFLANPVEIANATLRIDETGAMWDPVAFSYGPVSGTATLKLAVGCLAGEKCTPQFTADFGSLDAGSLQAALLGAREPGTLLSSLLERLRPGSSPGWPELNGIARAGSLLIGPIALNNAEANVRLQPDGAEIGAFDAALFGGRVHLQGSIHPGDKPHYSLEGQFDHVSAGNWESCWE